MRRVLAGVLALLVLVLGLVSCVPRLQPSRSDRLTFSGPAPDIVLLSISGRCGPPCVSPRDNWAYLSSRGSVDRLADVFTAVGYRVQTANYASHVVPDFTPPYLEVTEPGQSAAQRGFAALNADLQAIHTAWPRPPRIVLLAHSHGVAWSHHLARLNPDTRIALQVDLDGICFAWNGDYGAAARGFEALDVAAACQSVDLGGGERALAKDVVWPNVDYNLEVHSKRLPSFTGPGGGLPVNYLFERAPNVRANRQAAGLERFVSEREDHSAVTYPSSDAMAWVTERAASLASLWRVQDGARPLPPR